MRTLLILCPVLVALALGSAAPAYADGAGAATPPASQSKAAPRRDLAPLRARIRTRTIELRIDAVAAKVRVSPAERKQLELLLDRFDRKRDQLRRQRRKLTREMKTATGKDADPLFERFLAHRQRTVDLEVEQARAVRQVFGSKRALRAVVILARSQRRIEARMRQALRKARHQR